MSRAELIQKRREIWVKIKDIKILLYGKNITSREKLEQEKEKLLKKYEFYTNMINNWSKNDSNK